MIVILTAFSALMLLIDIARAGSMKFRSFYDSILGNILRSHEGKEGGFQLTGGTHIVLAFLLCALIFPKPLAIMSMFIVVFSDTMAALVGIKFGRTKIGNNKTLEGSLAFLFTGLAVVYLSPKLSTDSSEVYVGTAAAVITTLAELLPLKTDDNIVIPMVFGISYLIIFKMFIN